MSGSETARLEVREGDITALDADAIVNAANEALLPGGGVCGAIHAAAGPGLAAECARVAPCPVGDARVTSGGRLGARIVLHAVGPVWRGGRAGEPALLASCYRRCLEIACERGLGHVAFPAISTGIYGFPARPALRVAFETILDFLARHDVPRRVTFCTFGAEMTAAAREALAAALAERAAPRTTDEADPGDPR